MLESHLASLQNQRDEIAAGVTASVVHQGSYGTVATWIHEHGHRIVAGLHEQSPTADGPELLDAQRDKEQQHQQYADNDRDDRVL